MVASPITLAPARAVVSRELFAFVLGALLFARVQAGGTFFLPEIVLIFSIPALYLERGREPIDRRIAIALVLGVVWLWAQVFSDIYRESALHDYSRGWANITFTLANLFALALLLRCERRMLVAYGWGLVVGFFLEYLITPSLLAQGEAWKFGLSMPVTLGVALLASRPRYLASFVPTFALVGIGVVNLVLGFRSLAGVCVLAGVYCAAQRHATRNGLRPIPFSFRRALVVGGLILSYAVVGIYGRYASSGALGTRAAATYTAEAGGLGLLINGRAENYGSWLAIRDSPLVGWGSWAHGQRFVDATRNAVAPRPYTQLDDTIPVHSHLFWAWVDAGLFGTLIWFFAIGLAIRVAATLYRTSEPLTPLISFVTTLFLWDVFFSPYGAERRLLTPYYLILFVFALRKSAEGLAEDTA